MLCSPMGAILLTKGAGVCAGRKHQLRKACANVLHAPILGDGRYALLRSPEQRWFQERLQELPAVSEDRPEDALGSMLRCNRHLQLHCFQVSLIRASSIPARSLGVPDPRHSFLARCLLLHLGNPLAQATGAASNKSHPNSTLSALQLRVRDAEGFFIEATAPLPSHMRKAIKMLFRSLPGDLDAALPKMVQLADFTSPHSLQQALMAAKHSVQSRQHEDPIKATQSSVLPRSTHVELPADAEFQHLASLSTAKGLGTRSGRTGGESEGSESDSDGESRPRKSRWTSAEKREAKDKRRALKKARREREKEYRRKLETPLQWE